MMGGASYLPLARHLLLFQAEFILYLIGTSCTVERMANTEQCLEFRKHVPGGCRVHQLCFIPTQLFWSGKQLFSDSHSSFAFPEMSKGVGCLPLISQGPHFHSWFHSEV